MFITIEGMDGSGKTTLINELKKHLSKKYDLVITREPGGEIVSEKIREVILNNNMDAWTEALLFIAARNEHIKNVIKPALEQNKIVICDRFMDSTSAYQGNARNIGIDKTDEIQKMVFQNFCPQLTLFLHVDEKTANERLNKRSKDTQNRLDNETAMFKKKIYEGYKYLIENNPDRIKVIDATKSIEEIVKDSIFEIETALKAFKNV